MLAVAEGQKLREDLLDAGLVRLDRLIGQEFAALVLAGGIADARRAAAHQRDRLAAGLLQPAQHHDLDKRADMQRRRGAVEADIGDEIAALGLLIDALEIGALMQKAALGQHGEKIGTSGGWLRTRRTCAVGTVREAYPVGAASRPSAAA